MRTIVHLSDLHFGRVDPRVLGAMAEEIADAAPDIVVVSGDMTQRAKTEEFVAARAFLDSLPVPWIGVPGNHDVPLYNVFKRAFLPFSRYRRHIAAVTEPFWSDDEIAICGVNTARSLTFKDGRINRQQLASSRSASNPVGRRLSASSSPIIRSRGRASRTMRASSVVQDLRWKCSAGAASTWSFPGTSTSTASGRVRCATR